MDLPEGWETGSVDADGVSLRYYRVGEGDPIVLAHGMFANGRRWTPLVADLAREHEVIAYDARGHGGSDAPETGYDLETRVADLVGLTEGLDLDEPVYCGHSMGGATVAWAAAEHPDLARGLVLEEPARLHPSPDVDPERGREVGLERLREEKERTIDERIARHDEEVGHTEHDREVVRNLAVATDECSPNAMALAQAHPPVAEAFDEIDCPTLVVRRDRDVEGRVADLAVADRLSEGRLIHLPDVSHHVLLDAPEALSAEFQTILRRLDR